MMSGWDVYENPDDVNWDDYQKVYFSGEDDGHQVKKGWVYTVPAEGIDPTAYAEDEEKYMYFNNSGDIVSNQFKKINGKYYVFNGNGIMKTGLIVWCANGREGGGTNAIKYVDKIDLDWATGEELAKSGRYNLGKDKNNSDKYITVNTDGLVIGKSNNGDDSPKVSIGVDKLKLHYFGEDGARKTGMNTVEFTDDAYTINTVGSSGDKGTGVFAKKYYSLGVLLKASQDIRYGIYQQATTSMLKAQNPDNGGNYYQDLTDGKYLVLTTSGSKQKGNKTAKKDADGNYWMISNTDSSLRGIYSVGIKEDNSLSNFRTKTLTSVNNWGDNSIHTTREVATAYPQLFVSDYAEEAIGNSYHPVDDPSTSSVDESKEIKGITWVTHNIANSTDVYFTCNYSGPCFQSDYNDGTNKWIPFGMLDNALKSATFRWTEYDDTASVGYEVKPTNDYFVNCSWNGIK